MTKKTEMHRLKKDPELYYYFNTKDEKRFAYRHRYYDSLGNRREKQKQGFKSENEAYRGLLEVRTKIINGDVKQVAKANVTISEWLDIWYESSNHEWGITTRLQRERDIKKHMKPLLGHYKVAELDKSTYKIKFIQKLLKTMRPTSVKQLHKLFKIAVNAAVDAEIIPRNRFTNITFDEETVGNNYFTAQELVEFLHICKKVETITNYSMGMFLAYTGVRKGEACGLKWRDIQDDICSINCTRDDNGVRPPKTKNSFRSIVMDPVLVKQMNIYKKWCRETRIKYGLPFNENTYVFINGTSGLEINCTMINNAMKRIIEKHNLKEVTPHGLRHTHATILMKERIPVKTISERLGNTPEMINNVYGHNLKELELEAVQVFGEALKII
ncbi:tyrosine-type recombinase/integrase [Psychrobacillus sp. NPDC093200]|uniref:tyrosine-type recombinase/integrase n=1 Tax=Psychrobacillus sp. NPDC093200 TaxID=3390656 RepID=UPI003D043BE2